MACRPFGRRGRGQLAHDLGAALGEAGDHGASARSCSA
jgi:hypothetical protein